MKKSKFLAFIVASFGEINGFSMYCLPERTQSEQTGDRVDELCSAFGKRTYLIFSSIRTWIEEIEKSDALSDTECDEKKREFQKKLSEACDQANEIEERIKSEIEKIFTGTFKNANILEIERENVKKNFEEVKTWMREEWMPGLTDRMKDAVKKLCPVRQSQANSEEREKNEKD